MEFNEELFKTSQKFRLDHPDIVNKGISIDNYLLSVFSLTPRDNSQMDILKLLNAFRRNFLTASFLFESQQWNVWVQATRTMIESWEILCAYLVSPQEVGRLIRNSNGKSISDKLFKIIGEWITKLNYKRITKLISDIKNTKTTLNNTLSHANAAYNLVYSGIKKDEDGVFTDWFFDSNEEQIISNYLFLLTIYHDFSILIFELISKVELEPYLTDSLNEVPDFHLEDLFWKYVPTWYK